MLESLELRNCKPQESGAGRRRQLESTGREFASTKDRTQCKPLAIWDSHVLFQDRLDSVSEGFDSIQRDLESMNPGLSRMERAAEFSRTFVKLIKDELPGYSSLQARYEALNAKGVYCSDATFLGWCKSARLPTLEDLDIVLKAVEQVNSRPVQAERKIEAHNALKEAREVWTIRGQLEVTRTKYAEAIDAGHAIADKVYSLKEEISSLKQQLAQTYSEGRSNSPGGPPSQHTEELRRRLTRANLRLKIARKHQKENVEKRLKLGEKLSRAVDRFLCATESPQTPSP